MSRLAVSYPQPCSGRGFRRWCTRRACRGRWQARSMDEFRALPTQEVIIREGQLIWRVCGAGLCVENCSGTRAMAEFRSLCARHGIEPPTRGPHVPCRGPSESTEPGV